MRIAFDATVLQGRMSGVGYYCEELLKSLTAADPTSEFFVFSHRPVQPNGLGSIPNIRWIADRTFPIRAVYLHALLPSVLHRVRPDLCHYTNFLAPVADHHSYVVTVHDMGLEALRGCHPLAKRLYTKRLAPRAARNARLILTNSEYSKWEIVRRLGISEDRIRVTPLAASPDFRPVDVKRNGAPPYFLYVGNLEPRKNLLRLLDAFATLKHLDHELWIAGNAWYRAGAIQSKARALGLNGRIRFLGYVPREDLPGLYSGATAFVYPSLLEGFGLPVVEAMACGAAVVTSNNSSLREVAGDAALLIDPLDSRDIARAMARLALEPNDRAKFAKQGLARAAEFSWETTARLTLDAYQEAAGGSAAPRRSRKNETEIAPAIDAALHYAAIFDYPLKSDEVRERLFGVETDRVTFEAVLNRSRLKRCGEFICDDPESVRRRALREQISDRAIEQSWPRLRVLAGFPFVRMLAFSGATAHRNMSNGEDLDLFVVVESGKLWSTFLTAIIWAKLRGLRQRFCMNYLISDAVLPLAETDPFTAQQMASLKPFYGKLCYDRFIESNPFVRRSFPNFAAERNRAFYPEIATTRSKRVLEWALKCGPIQLFERVSRLALGWHLGRKVRDAAAAGDCDALIEPERLKLHLHSHKKSMLEEFRNVTSAEETHP
jgi:glycosyltransferase involved in cell wall biosynthesis